MILDWNEVINNNYKLKQIAGISIDEFNILYSMFNAKLFAIKNKNNVILGRPLVFNDIKIRLLIVYLYLKQYSTQSYLSVIFGISQSQISRIINEYSIILSQILKKEVSHCADDIVLIVDATEQAINRPKNNQKKYYSGKKNNIL